MVSLGTSVDCSVATIEVARLKIAVVNPNVPFAYGDLIPLSAFDHLVYDESPLITKDFVEPSEGNTRMGFRINSDGSGADRLIVPAGGFRLPISEETSVLEWDEDKNGRTKNELFMDGMAIFNFAITKVKRQVNALIEDMSWTKEDVGFYGLHQANEFMVNYVRSSDYRPVADLSTWDFRLWPYIYLFALFVLFIRPFLKYPSKNYVDKLYISPSMQKFLMILSVIYVFAALISVYYSLSTIIDWSFCWSSHIHGYGIPS